MKKRFALLLIVVLGLLPSYLLGQQVPTPKEHFGFNIGDDYHLATYTQTEAYFKKLTVSERVKLVNMGQTEEGRDQYMLIISSPANIKNIERYKEISQRMARAEGLTDQQAKALANEGRAVVWIDGGLHATETVGTHQLIETAYQLATRTDAETMEILSNVVVLLAHANPDGQELVSSWYMKDEDPTARRTNIPRLYQKYAGHDNNRDFYMLALKESRNLSRQLYIEWNPQILYNHHQSGPAGTVVAGPPFRDPFNYVYDPLVMTSLDAVGAAMANRLIAENKPGYTQKGGSQYSTWYNGGLRTTGYYHNVIGLLTEIIGSPTPSEIPVVPNRLLMSGANPFPIEAQKWNYRRSIDYSVSLNYAVLNYASRYRNELLYNLYRMGMNSVERGSKDSWTVSPKVIELLTATEPAGGQAAATGRPGGTVGRLTPEQYNNIIKDSARRDARAYIVPADQSDFPTAVRFINSLIGSGIRVHKATADFTVNGKAYPSGSFIVKTDQAFRPHVLDMFEPQDHPNDLQYPGGPPVAPYDAAGWTLAYQMGIQFDRILDKVDGPFAVLPLGEEQRVPAMPSPGTAKAGYLLSPKVNNSFIVVNDLLKAGVPVFRVTGDNSILAGIEPGTFYVPTSSKAKIIVNLSAPTNGVTAKAVDKAPSGTQRILPARIAIWNRYGGSMPSGWMTLIMEQFNYPSQYIYPQRIDAGDLRKDFDVIIFTSGAIPAVRRDAAAAPGQSAVPNYDETPAEFRHMMGSISQDKSLPQIKKFIEDGGIVITLESSGNISQHLDIPVQSALIRVDENGVETSLSRSDYYIPGSILTATVNNKMAATRGMPPVADFYFDESPVYKLGPDAEARGVKALAWFPNETPLKSGWALGQQYLKDGVIALEAPIGAGKVYIFGPNIAFRSQPYGLFKLLFNQLYLTEKPGRR